MSMFCTSFWSCLNPRARTLHCTENPKPTHLEKQNRKGKLSMSIICTIFWSCLHFSWEGKFSLYKFSLYCIFFPRCLISRSFLSHLYFFQVSRILFYCPTLFFGIICILLQSSNFLSFLVFSLYWRMSESPLNQYFPLNKIFPSTLSALEVLFFGDKESKFWKFGGRE